MAVGFPLATVAASAVCSGVGGGSHHPRTVAARSSRCLPPGVPPSGGPTRGAARRRGSRRGQTRPRASRAAARVGRAVGGFGDRGAGVSVAAGEGGEVGWL